MAKIHQVALTLLLPFSFAVAQQTITLNDGTQYQGRYAGGTADLISFVDQQGIRHRFGVNQVQSLYFSGPAADTGYSNQPPAQDPNAGVYRNQSTNVPPPNQGGYNQPPAYPNQQQPPYQNQPQPVYRSDNPPPDNAPVSQNGSYAVLPVNTQIAVRTADAIHTSGGAAGRTYAATIDQDVADSNGNIVIPRGSPAILVVRDMGEHQIVLDLQSVSVNGQRYALNTQDITQTGHSNRGVGANQRTGVYAGGGAVLGTLLGAIAGGGRGAAIGAVAGAAAGVGTEVLTKGSEVRVPAETVLSFQLDQPVYLNQ